MSLFDFVYICATLFSLEDFMVRLFYGLHNLYITIFNQKPLSDAEYVQLCKSFQKFYSYNQYCNDEETKERDCFRPHQQHLYEYLAASVCQVHWLLVVVDGCCFSLRPAELLNIF